MRRIYKNKSRNCPFSDDFLEGFNSGTDVQFEADVKVLEDIKAEIINLTITPDGEEYVRKMAELYSLKRMVIAIIDKHIKE